MESQFCQHFKASCYFRMQEATRMLDIALSKLSQKQLWERPNENSLSIGNQLLHLKGNITQYIISTLGQQADIRNRDLEFDIREGMDLETLWNDLKNTLETAKTCIQKCPEALLLKEHSVQGFDLIGVDVALHAVEHLSYHTGQVAFWVKQLTNAPLGFYEGMDLNTKNKS